MKLITDSLEYEFEIERENEDENNIIFKISHNKKMTFLERLVFSVKYLFGYKCLYGSFDCHSATKENLKKIISRLN